VAVKTVLFSEQRNGTEQRAIMEAAVCATINHPNVVCTYHYDITPVRSDSSRLVVEHESGSPHTTDYKLYLVQELCNATLKAVLGDNLLHGGAGAPDMDPILTILCDIARGMDYIHSKNVIHGDLKPENVLLKVDKTSPIGVVAKISDFGLAKAIPPNESHLSGIKGGTPFYQAPETVHKGMLTKTSDVYSFGVLMWESYRRTPPWVKKPQGGYHHNRNFGKFAVDTPLVFQRLCRRCLDPGPRNRPTFKEILAELDAMLGAYLDGYDDLVPPSHSPAPGGAKPGGALAAAGLMGMSGEGCDSAASGPLPTIRLNMQGSPTHAAPDMDALPQRPAGVVPASLPLLRQMSFQPGAHQVAGRGGGAAVPHQALAMQHLQHKAATMGGSGPVQRLVLPTPQQHAAQHSPHAGSTSPHGVAGRVPSSTMQHLQQGPHRPQSGQLAGRMPSATAQAAGGLAPPRPASGSMQPPLAGGSSSNLNPSSQRSLNQAVPALHAANPPGVALAGRQGSAPTAQGPARGPSHGSLPLVAAGVGGSGSLPVQQLLKSPSNQSERPSPSGLSGQRASDQGRPSPGVPASGSALAAPPPAAAAAAAVPGVSGASSLSPRASPRGAAGDLGVKLTSADRRPARNSLADPVMLLSAASTVASVADTGAVSVAGGGAGMGGTTPAGAAAAASHALAQNPLSPTRPGTGNSSAGGGAAPLVLRSASRPASGSLAGKPPAQRSRLSNPGLPGGAGGLPDHIGI